jgi:hypothetical protein
MFETLLESVIPGGVYMAVGLALGAAFSKQLRPLVKEAVKAGLSLAAVAEEAAAEAYERSQDLIAEARYEQEQATAGADGRAPRSAARRSRATESAKS